MLTEQRSLTAPVHRSRRRWAVLGVVVAAEAMDLVDSTVVNVAAPSVRADLGGGPELIQWLAAGYTLAFGVLLLLGGRLGDVWGRRRLFLIGAAGFTVATTLCALAPGPGLAIAARVAQGAFGALLIPQGLGLLRTVFPPDEQARAFGVFAPVLGLSAVTGPILAGALIQLDVAGLGWRLVFVVTVPVGLAVLAGALRWAPADPPRGRERFDVLGAFLVAAASLAVIYPLTEGRAAGWPAWSVGSLVAGLVLFGLFVRRERRCAHPVLAPSLLRNRAYLAGIAVGLAIWSAMAGALLGLALFTQVGLGLNPLRAGLLLAPVSAGIVVASVACHRLTARYGRRLLGTGVALVALAFVLLAVAAPLTRPDGLALLAPLAVLGLGLGLVFSALFGVILAGVTDAETGSASGALSAAQQLFSAFGVAVLTTLYLAVAAGHDPRTALAVTALTAAGLTALGGIGVALLPARARAGHG